MGKLGVSGLMLQRKVLIVLMVIAAMLFIPFTVAQAQSGVELSTTYPGISASPGETVSFSLDVKNNSTVGQIVQLEVTSIPEGWNTSLKGRGRDIQQVYIQDGSYVSPEMEVDIPEDAAAGEYDVTVRADGERGQDSLTLNIIIAEAETGNDELKAQYSELKGPSDATFNFKLDLINNGINEKIYSLGAEAPPGWQISFKPSYENQQVASISVKGGETKGLDVTVTPAASVEAGEYTIPVNAVSSSGRASEELKIIISGTYDVELTTPSGRLNAEVVAGQEKKVNLEVRNNGSAVLNNINFTSREPQNWSVTFDPKTVETLKPGESRQVIANISADGKAIAGDYVVSMTASTAETRDQSEFRVTVKTSTLWGIVGLLIVLLVIAGIYWTFRTYGRR